MPELLTLIRHGESEGNIAGDKSKKGDHSLFNDEFLARHSSLWRLSRRGIEQAQQTGEWLRHNHPETFDRLYVSSYIRAQETAAHLAIPNAAWNDEFYLRERSWGELDRMSAEEREKRFSENLQERKRSPFYWRPPNGESMAEMCLRVDRVLDTLHRECDGKRVAIVCHGEVMWGFRVRLERMEEETFLQLDGSKHPHDRIHNCQVLQYTRQRDPNNPDAQGLTPYLGWMRSICPWDTDKSPNKWTPIVRKRYTNEELLVRAERVKPIHPE